MLRMPLGDESDNDDEDDDWLLLELLGPADEVASIWRLVCSCMKRA